MARANGLVAPSSTVARCMRYARVALAMFMSRARGQVQSSTRFRARLASQRPILPRIASVQLFSPISLVWRIITECYCYLFHFSFLEIGEIRSHQNPSVYSLGLIMDAELNLYLSIFYAEKLLRIDSRYCHTFTKELMAFCLGWNDMNSVLRTDLLLEIIVYIGATYLVAGSGLWRNWLVLAEM